MCECAQTDREERMESGGLVYGEWVCDCVQTYREEGIESGD